MTTVTDRSSFFTAVNARYLSPPQVARSFVPYEPYDRLLAPENTVLVGPRGSGKTTLFKMLQSDALEVWKHPLASNYAEQIIFSSVLVPADPAWHAQLSGLRDSAALTRQEAEALGVAAFTSHVLQSLIRVMRRRTSSRKIDVERLFQRVSLQQPHEATLVTELSRSWALAPTDQSLAGLDWALGSRIARIGQAAEGGLRPGDDAFLNMDFVACVSHGIDIFNELTHEPDRRWALLFDELETAPAGLRTRLIRLFRMGNPRVFLKLSMFPITPELDPIDPQLDPLPGQDYEFISLSVPRRRTSVRFASEITETILGDRGIQTTASAFLGRANFVPATDLDGDVGTPGPLRTRRERFARDNPSMQTIRELAASDATFNEYVGRVGLKTFLETGRGSEAEIKAYEKIQNLALARAIFGGSQRRQSRRSYALYTGHPVVLTLMESQPRLLVIFIRALLQDPTVSNRASPRQQSLALEKVMAHVLDFLRTVPVQVGRSHEFAGEGKIGHSAAERSSALSIVDFVDRIGAALGAAALTGPFDADAVGSFFLGQETEPAIYQTVETAINVGAIVRIPRTEGEYSPMWKVSMEKLRLSFLLAPRYHLPIRVGRAVRIERLLQHDPSQLLLFDESEAIE